MTVRIHIGDVRARLAELSAASVDCVVTSPPYWGLRDYGMVGQLGTEQTLGEHLAIMVDVFDAVRRVMKPSASLWLNYGDCYATSPNGRSAADTKAAGNDDRTFRDKPFSTIGPIFDPGHTSGGFRKDAKRASVGDANSHGRIVAGGYLKPKDLCMVANRLAIALQEAGWWVRSEIIWGKPNGMPDSSGRYRPSVSFEKIFLLGKTGDIYYDFEAVKKPTEGPVDYKAPDSWNTAPGAHGSFHPKGREKGKKADKQRGHSRRHAGFNDRCDGMSREEQQANGRLLRNFEPIIWEIPIAGYSEAHFATFPPELARRCILAGCPEGGTVLDPFFGAGTTGLVADRLGRNCIGIELNPEYARMARRRIMGDAPMFTQVDTYDPADDSRRSTDLAWAEMRRRKEAGQ